MEFKDIKERLIKKLQESDDYSDIYRVCDIGKDLAYYGNLEEDK